MLAQSLHVTNLQQATDQMTRFLAARLLFLITISGVETSIIHLVEDLQISKQLTARLLDNLEELATLSTSTSSASARDGTMVNIVNPNDAVLKMKIDILIEYLKVAFNVSLFYPRAVKERQEKTKKQKSTLESSAMSKSTSSSSTASSSSSSSSKSKSSRSSSPIEGINGRLSPKNTFDNTTSRIGVSHDVARTKSSSSSSTTSNGRSKSPSNLPKKATEIYKGATEKARGYFSRKGKETENVSVKEMYAEDADVLKSWGFEE